MVVIDDPGIEELEAATSVASLDGVVIPRRHGRPSVLLWVAVGWIGLLILVAITVQWLPLHPYTTVAGMPNQPPSFSSDFLGTDDIGRSMLSRMCYGARVSLIISFVAVGIAALVGGGMGLLAAYFRGATGAATDTVSNALVAVPHLLLLMAIVLAFGGSVPVVMIALSLIFIPSFMRLMKTNALSQLGREYILSARAMGATSFRVMLRDLLPNTAPSLLSYAVVVLPAAMITEGALSFLGFGVQPPTPTWGGMIALGAQNLTLSPWPAVVPCAILSLTVLSLNILGDNLRNRLDVREAKI